MGKDRGIERGGTDRVQREIPAALGTVQSGARVRGKTLDWKGGSAGAVGENHRGSRKKVGTAALRCGDFRVPFSRGGLLPSPARYCARHTWYGRRPAAGVEAADVEEVGRGGRPRGGTSAHRPRQHGLISQPCRVAHSAATRHAVG